MVHPVDASSIEGSLDAAKAGLIGPILVRPEAGIRAAAATAAAGLDLTGIAIEDTPHGCVHEDLF